METLKKIKFIINILGLFRFFVLFLLSLTVTALELLGITLLVPFITILNDLSIIQSNEYLFAINQWLKIESPQHFLIYCGLLVIIISLIKAGVTILVRQLVYQFSYNGSHLFSTKLFGSYLSKNYSFFLEQDSSTLLRNVAQVPIALVQGVIIPGINIFTNILIVFSVLVLLLIVSFKMTMGLLLFFGIILPLMLFAFRKKLDRLSKTKNELNIQIFKIASQTFQGIKDIFVLNKRHFFYQNLHNKTYEEAKVDSKNRLITDVPYITLEFIGLAAIILLVIVLIYLGTSMSEIIELVGFYAVSAYRVLPKVSEIPQAANTIKFHLFTVDIVYDGLKEYKNNLLIPQYLTEEKVEPLHFKNEIEVKNLVFKYPKSEKLNLDNVNLKIKKNSSNAFVGSSGGGKSTLADVLIGLHPTVTNSIIIDGEPLNNDNINDWRANVGYIPQSIYLYDDTLLANIAFGVHTEKIDNEKINKVIEISRLKELTDSLPNGVNEYIGERGIKLSGGQRQRIGIARALYNDPDLLIMDEATSALDNLTEAEIVEEMNELVGMKTLIIIAHRLSTIKNCDVIHVLDQGKLVCSGSYDQLLAECPQFLKLVNLSHSNKDIIK